MRTSTLRTGILLLVLAMVVAACGDDNATDTSTTTAAASTTAAATTTTTAATTTTTAAPAEPILIGAILPLTGDFVSLAADAQAGIEMAVDEINAAGGVLGRPLQAIFEDSGTDPTITINAITKLTTSDHVSAILGSLCSGCSIQAQDTIQAAGVPYLTVGESSVAVSENGGEWIFQSTDAIRETVNTFIAAIDARSATSVGILASEKSEPGQELRQLLEDHYAGTGTTVDSSIVQTGSTDYRPYLTKFQQDGAQVIVSSGLVGEETGFLLRQLEDLGMTDIPVLGLVWVPSILDTASAAEVANYYFTQAYVPTDPSAANQAFRTAFQAKTDGQDPGKYAAIAYTHMYVLAAAMELAGSTDPAAVRDQIRNVQYVGPTGQPNFNDTGLNLLKAHLAQYQNGEVVVVD